MEMAQSIEMVHTKYQYSSPVVRRFRSPSAENEKEDAPSYHSHADNMSLPLWGAPVIIGSLLACLVVYCIAHVCIWGWPTPRQIHMANISRESSLSSDNAENKKKRTKQIHEWLLVKKWKETRPMEVGDSKGTEPMDKEYQAPLKLSRRTNDGDDATHVDETCSILEVAGIHGEEDREHPNGIISPAPQLNSSLSEDIEMDVVKDPPLSNSTMLKEGATENPCTAYEKFHEQNHEDEHHASINDVKDGKDDDVCGICLIPFEPDDLVGCSWECSHILHKDCISKWLLRHENCPFCRKAFLNPTPLDSSSFPLEDDVQEQQQNGDSNNPMQVC